MHKSENGVSWRTKVWYQIKIWTLTWSHPWNKTIFQCAVFKTYRFLFIILFIFFILFLLLFVFVFICLLFGGATWLSLLPHHHIIRAWICTSCQHHFSYRLDKQGNNFKNSCTVRIMSYQQKFIKFVLPSVFQNATFDQQLVWSSKSLLYKALMLNILSSDKQCSLVKLLVWLLCYWPNTACTSFLMIIL